MCQRRSNRSWSPITLANAITIIIILALFISNECIIDRESIKLSTIRTIGFERSLKFTVILCKHTYIWTNSIETMMIVMLLLLLIQTYENNWNIFVLLREKTSLPSVLIIKKQSSVSVFLSTELNLNLTII